MSFSKRFQLFRNYKLSSKLLHSQTTQHFKTHLKKEQFVSFIWQRNNDNYTEYLNSNTDYNKVHKMFDFQTNKKKLYELLAEAIYQKVLFVEAHSFHSRLLFIIILVFSSLIPLSFFEFYVPFLINTIWFISTTLAPHYFTQACF